MTNDGGRANEPTSYSLRPPHAPAAPVPAPQPPPEASDAPPQGSRPPGRAAEAAGPARSAYEPTQFADPRGGPQPPTGEPPTGEPPTGDRSAEEPSAGRQPAAGAQDPNSGRLIGGRYQLVSRLGHGGMGTVWRAHDQIVDRDVAVKEPRVPDHLPERERQTVYQRMQREARAAARIDHPSVVTVHDVVVEGGRPWIVMELVRGQSLGDRLMEGTLDPREAARIGLSVLGALAAAHEAGVLHRDVKPDNVLLGRSGRVVLTDFGIAQIEGEQRLTETGGFVGSPEFIAPERVLGQRPGPESDLWSLGVVLYAAVEGMSPFRRSHAPATLQAVLGSEPQVPARATGPLATLIMQLLRKDPAMRPAAPEVRQALEAAAKEPQPVPTMLATAGYAPGGAQRSAGSRFVPPILHKNRKAQLGLGGLVLVVAAALVLTIMKPFSGEGLPPGWTVREERDVVGASLAVPGEYRRVQDDSDSDNPVVTYYDPSGVFTVSLKRSTPDGENDPASLEAAADQIVAFYKDGGGATVEEAKSEQTGAGQQGKAARDVTTSYLPYGTSSNKNPIRYVKRDHLYLNKAKVAWDLTVTMPAHGDAQERGEELYERIVRNLRIDQL
ncbi:serine/threonine-protein kinase [Streptomyces malaysiensis subsp. malaysiensis]|uniref:serine/threonine-protein kinase n=1 Tax=Streptomyces malaysiensis TaxID=92644 RepID=UPI0024C0C05D|nr:serine/threonine-protein kinase [Streptomyces sp. NA07423]WHX20324.1 serine/threonine-protein kinase [Streptomyces sp. NA07423]